MITFKEFLLEEDQLGIDVEEAVKIYREDIKWLDPEKPLYRWGSWNTSNTQISVRSSRERKHNPRQTKHDWVFEQPGWEKFPRRTHSIFTSTTKKVAEGLSSSAKVAMIYPFKDIEMGLVPDIDFNYMKIFKGTPYEIDYSELGLSLSMLASYAGARLETRGVKNEFEFIQNASSDKFREQLEKYGKRTATQIDNYVERFEFYKKNLLQALEPEALGVKLVSSTNFKVPRKAQEVWFEGKYLVVPESYFKLFLRALES